MHIHIFIYMANGGQAQPYARNAYYDYSAGPPQGVNPHLVYYGMHGAPYGPPQPHIVMSQGPPSVVNLFQPVHNRLLGSLQSDLTYLPSPGQPQQQYKAPQTVYLSSPGPAQSYMASDQGFEINVYNDSPLPANSTSVLPTNMSMPYGGVGQLSPPFDDHQESAGAYAF